MSKVWGTNLFANSMVGRLASTCYIYMCLQSAATNDYDREYWTHSMRMIDWQCPACAREEPDVLANCEDVRSCPHCGHAMSQVWWKRHNAPAQWDDKTSVVLFRGADGSIRYPGRNDLPTPQGYERVHLRSLHEVERFEREHGVRSEMAWYDRGSGRGHDDYYNGQKLTH